MVIDVYGLLILEILSLFRLCDYVLFFYDCSGFYNYVFKNVIFFVFFVEKYN